MGRIKPFQTALSPGRDDTARKENLLFLFLGKRSDTIKARKIFINHGVSLIPVLSKNLELKSTISLNDVLTKKNY